MENPFDAQLRARAKARIMSARATRSAATPLHFIVTLIVAALASLTLVMASPAGAHKGKKDEAAQQFQPGQGRTPTPGELTVGKDMPMDGMMSSKEDRAKMPFGERLIDWFGRVHTIIIHFPIAFFPAALFTAIVGRRRPAFIKPVQFLVLAGGLVAPVAALLGWFNGGFSLSDSDPLLAVHRWLGTAIGVGGFGLAIWAWRRPEADRSIGMITALTAITAAVIVQGWFGGALVHGIDHLNW